LRGHGGRPVDGAGSGEEGEVTLKALLVGCARGVNEAERMVSPRDLLGLVSLNAFSALRVALAQAFVFF